MVFFRKINREKFTFTSNKKESLKLEIPFYPKNSINNFPAAYTSPNIIAKVGEGVKNMREMKNNKIAKKERFSSL